MKNLITWVTENWGFITGALVPLVLLIVNTLLAKNKIGKIKEDASKWQQIGKMGLEWIELSLARSGDSERTEAVNELVMGQRKAGIQKEVDEELNNIRSERKKNASKLGINLDMDMDSKGKLTPGISIGFEKLF